MEKRPSVPEESFPPGTRVTVEDARTVMAELGDSHWTKDLEPFCGGASSAKVIRHSGENTFLSFEVVPERAYEASAVCLTFPRKCLVRV